MLKKIECVLSKNHVCEILLNSENFRQYNGFGGVFQCPNPKTAQSNQLKINYSAESVKI